MALGLSSAETIRQPQPVATVFDLPQFGSAAVWRGCEVRRHCERNRRRGLSGDKFMAIQRGLACSRIWDNI